MQDTTGPEAEPQGGPEGLPQDWDPGLSIIAQALHAALIAEASGMDEFAQSLRRFAIAEAGLCRASQTAD